MAYFDKSTAIDAINDIYNLDSKINNALQKINNEIKNMNTNLEIIKSAHGKLESEPFIEKIDYELNTETYIRKKWNVIILDTIYKDISVISSEVEEIKSETENMDSKNAATELVVEIMTEYNLGIEKILAAGITIPESMLKQTFYRTELPSKIAWNEYDADKGNWAGISKENEQWWIDKPLKFEKDPNKFGTNAWLVLQQDENGNWVGMGFTDEQTALGYSQAFGSELEGLLEETKTTTTTAAAMSLLGVVSPLTKNPISNAISEMQNIQNKKLIDQQKDQPLKETENNSYAKKMQEDLDRGRAAKASSQRNNAHLEREEKAAATEQEREKLKKEAESAIADEDPFNEEQERVAQEKLKKEKETENAIADEDPFNEEQEQAAAKKAAEEQAAATAQEREKLKKEAENNPYAKKMQEDWDAGTNLKNKYKLETEETEIDRMTRQAGKDGTYVKVTYNNGDSINYFNKDDPNNTDNKIQTIHHPNGDWEMLVQEEDGSFTYKDSGGVVTHDYDISDSHIPFNQNKIPIINENQAPSPITILPTMNPDDTRILTDIYNAKTDEEREKLINQLSSPEGRAAVENFLSKNK